MSALQRNITHFLHSRYATVLSLVLLALSAIFAMQYAVGLGAAHSGAGMLVPPATTWIESPLLSMAASICLIGASCMLVAHLLRVYNFLRAMTMLPATLMVVMITALPALTTRLNSGVVMLSVVLVCTIMLFQCYGDKHSMHNVFLIFFILSAMVATQFAYLIYIPAFFIGCLQMRIVRLRTILAILLGLVTPWWLIFGFGLAGFDTIHIPDFHNIFTDISADRTAVLLVLVALTVFVGIAAWVMSLMKTMTYNASSRAFNGFFTVVMFFTILAVAVDYANMSTYVPLLACCASVQVAHVFCIHRREKSYIGILCIAAAYYLMYIWRILV